MSDDEGVESEEEEEEDDGDGDSSEEVEPQEETVGNISTDEKLQVRGTTISPEKPPTAAPDAQQQDIQTVSVSPCAYDFNRPFSTLQIMM